MTRTRITETIAWQSDNPHLTGNFAPIGSEIDAGPLQVIEGRVPEDLAGAYVRNGPNPRYEPASYNYPLEGDGMLHALRFEGGKAFYSNRYVRTSGFEVENRAGRRVYGGVMAPQPVDPALLGPHDDPENPFKMSAFIGVQHHGGHLLATGEGEPAWDIGPDLETRGPWTAGTDTPLIMGAHNRVHPVTGDLFALTYDLESPTVTMHHVGRDGQLRRSFDIGLAAPSMIHDFVLTERYLVLLIGPVVFDMESMMSGGSFIQWRPEIGTRIAVMPLDGGDVRWFEAEPFFVFHFANGFERGEEIVVDYVRHQKLYVGYGERNTEPPTPRRLVLDLGTGRVTQQTWFDRVAEFPRIDDRRNALPTRYVYAPTLTPALTGGNGASGTFNCLLRIDTETGDILPHDFGNHIAGEAVFIPRGEGETEGWLATYLYDPETETSDFVLLDADGFGSDPVVRLRLPQRVPQGLHGTWVPA
ncbi:carotenoid oxygenase family protein [Chachezhania sediminis]|uniref:carotenoid oxygenase family protein n=1 Tax=Chachezhania sediminis TaxID=2599291 RepID=UPI00131BDD3B|nr:carotenoid oxygenase family protein [Chachezhania sediminis]